MTKRAHPQTKQQVDIFQYSLKHSGGMAYLYENNTTNKTLEEKLKFKMEGLEIVGNESAQEVQIKIKPGESKFIQLKALVPQWKIGTGVAYGIY